MRSSIKAPVAAMVVAVIAAVVSAQTVVPNQCVGTGYVASSGRCYRQADASSERATWSEARTACIAEEASLVSIHSSAENAQVSSSSESWIGLFQVESDASAAFQWSNEETVGFTNWASGMPDDGGNGNGNGQAAKKSTQDCAVIMVDGTWDDRYCTSEYAFVCVKDALCPKGYYLSQSYQGWNGVQALCTACPGGTYSDSVGGVGVGSCSQCAAGRIGSAGRSSACVDECPQGYYCPAGTSADAAVNSDGGMQACPAGLYGPAPGKKTISDCKPCDPGYFCAGSGNADPAPADAQCAAGRCGFAGQNTTQCAQDCPAGYFCPQGSACPEASKWDNSTVSNGASACGGANVYCPSGSEEPTAVDAGMYTVGGSATQRTSQSACEPGYYCTSGVRSPCPGGTYNEVLGAESTADCLACDAGYICPSDRINTSPQAVNCYDKVVLDEILPGHGWTAGAQVFCPLGSALPTAVGEGNYSTPTSSRYIVNRRAQAVCSSTRICVNGVSYWTVLWHWTTPEKSCRAGAMTIDVDEMTPGGTTLFDFRGQLNSRGSDLDLSLGFSMEEMTYYDTSIAECAPDSLEKNMDIFKLDNTTGEVTVVRDGLQFETCLPNIDMRYTATIQVHAIRPDGSIKASDTCVLTFRIGDLNDEPLFVDYDAEDSTSQQPVYYRQIREGVQQNIPVEACTSLGRSYGCPDSLSGAVAPEIAAEDEDDGSVLQYAIVDGDDGAETVAERIFKIDPCTGLVSTRRAYELSYADKSTYTYNISITDDGNGGLYEPFVKYATLVIYIIDVNDVPIWVYNASETDLTIVENEPEGTEVLMDGSTTSGASLAALATDGDNDELSFRIEINDGGAFQIIDNKLVTTSVGASTINFETSKDVYYLDIEVSDGRGGAVVGTIEVRVLNANDPPILTSSTRIFYIPEEVSGVEACDVLATSCDTSGAVTATDEDADPNDEITFVLVDTLDGTFSIGASTGIITVETPLDFEDETFSLLSGTGRGLTLTVQATSNGGTSADTSDDQTTSVSVTVYIVDVNEAPVGFSFGYLVPESWPVGAEMPYHFNANDPDNADTVLLGKTAPVQTLTYSNGDSNSFWAVTTTETNTCALKVASSLVRANDYLTAWPVSIRVQDNGGPTRGETIYDINIYLLDTNEAPAFSQATFELSADENADFESATISASDGDDGDVLSYELVGGNGAVFFEIVDGDGDALNPGFKVKKRDVYESSGEEVILDYELSSKEWTLKVKVKDQGPSAMTGQFCDTLSTESPCGGGAYCLAGRCAQICYDTDDGKSASAWQEDVGPESFYMCHYDYFSSSSAEPLMSPSYIDGVETDFFVESATVSVVVNIVDQNDPPRFTSCDDLQFQVVSNRAEQDQIVAQAGILDSLTYDEDTSAAYNRAWTYSFQDNAGFFSINAADNSIVYTASDNTDGVLVDGDVYLPTLRVADADDSSKFTDCDVTILVIQQNTAPVMLDYTTATLNENADTSSEIVLLESMVPLVTDPDDDETLTFTSSSNGYFSVDSSTGRLTVDAAVVSYESLPDPHTYELIVRVRDSKGAEDVATISIPIGDVNERPRFTTLLPTVTVSENNSPGDTLLGDLVALGHVSDPDVDATDPSWRALTFQLDACSEASCPFAVDSSTGSITVTSSLDFESDPTEFTLTVRATDGPGLYAVGAYTIQVIDVNEEPSFELNPTVTVNEGSDSSGSDLFNMKSVVNDPDAGDEPENLAYTILTADTPFVIEDGILKGGNSFKLDYETTQQHLVEIRASDGEFSDTATVTVNVVNLNDVKITSVTADNGGILACAGGTSVTLVGSNFGLVDNTVQPATLVVTYTNTRTGTSYTCANPTRGDTDNTQITCETVAGIGAGFTWTVQVTVAGTGIQGDASAAFATPALAYEAPAVTSVFNVEALPTRGGQTFALTGTCMGSAQDFASSGGFAQTPDTSVRYCSDTGACVEPTDCSMNAVGEVICTSLPSLGANLQWTVQVAGTRSGALLSGSHAAPEIETLSRTEFPADGSAALVISGTNFGPSGAVPDEAYAILSFAGASTQYALLGCEVTLSYEQVSCTGIEPGMGANMPVIIVFGGLANTASASATTVSFETPEITGLSGEAVNAGSTVGGQQIVVGGSGFGPACGRAATNDIESEPCPTLAVAYSRGSIRGYGSSAGEVIVYEPDCVVVNNVRIVCSTKPGTGADHVWTFDFGGHTGVSPPEGVTTSYAVPTVGAYEGAGADDALTSGGQTVLIKGSNFGPADGAEILAFYGPEDNPSEFADPATGDGIKCEIEAANEIVRCETVEGAGNELTWTVYVDGQQSRAETTSYGDPEISGISLSTLSVDGQEVVTLSGLNFGPSGRQEYLEDVTYGPVENPAAYSPDCDIVSHTSLQCTTEAGFGQDMSWTVTIKGQASSASSATTSYTPLLLGDVSFSSTATQGGYLMYLDVDGLPVCDAEAIISVVFGSQTVSYAFLYDDLVSAQPISDLEAYCASTAARGQRRVSFYVPELASADRTPSVGIVLSSKRFSATQATDVVEFAYAGPRLDSVYAEAAGGTSSALRVVLRGANFCRNTECCQTLVNGIVTSEWTHSHDTITLNADVDGATVQVQCGDQLSEVRFISTSNPFTYAAIPSNGADSVADVVYSTEIAAGSELIELYGLNYGNADPIVYVGENLATVVAHVNVSCSDEPVAPSLGTDGKCFHTTIEVPSGQGSSNGIKVLVNVDASGIAGAQSTPNALFEFVRYAAPSISAISIVDGDQPVPTEGGSTLRISGSNFGTGGGAFLYQHVGSAGTDVSFESYPALVGELTCTPWSHSELTCQIPPGEGYDLEILVVAGDQNSRVSAAGLPHTLSYAPPSVSEVLVDADVDIGAARTQGGDRLTLRGANFGRPYTPGATCVDLLQTNCTSFRPRVSLGGLACEYESNTHTEITCLVPPGQGADLSIMVTVRSQTTISSTQFSYAAPEVTSFTPLTAPTSGRVNGNAIMMEIWGDNFGIDDLEVRFIATDGSLDLLAVARNDDTDPSLYPLFSFNHTYITLQIPAYRGKDLRVVVDAAGQRGEASTLFSYAKPAVSGVQVMDPDDPSEFKDVSAGATGPISEDLLPTSYVPGSSLQARRQRRRRSLSSDVRVFIEGGRALADVALQLPDSSACQVSSLHRGYSWLTTAYTISDEAVFIKTTDLFLNEYCAGAAAVSLETRGGNYHDEPQDRADAGCTKTYHVIVELVEMTPLSDAGVGFLADAGCCGDGSFWSVGVTETCACEALASNRALLMTGDGYGVYMVDDLNDYYFSTPVSTIEDLLAQTAFDFPKHGPTLESVDARTLGDTPSGPTSGCYEFEPYDSYRERRNEAILLYGSALDVYRKCETKALMRLEGENFSTELLNTTNSKELEVVFVNLESGEEFLAATPSTTGDHSEACTVEDGCLHTHEEIIFQIPPGAGLNLVILLRVGNQETYAEDSTANGTVADARIRFNYLAPTVSRLSPGSLDVDSYEFADAGGGESVNVRGDNFGGVLSNTTLYFDGRICPDSQWRSPDEDLTSGLPFLSCTPEADVVGPRDLFVCVSNQATRVGIGERDPTLLLEADRIMRASNTSELSTEDQTSVDYFHSLVTSRYNTRCKSESERSGNILGQYGGLNQLCVECPSGSVCDKGDALLEDPYAASGYYRLDVVVFEEDGVSITDRAQSRCPQERWDRDLLATYPSMTLEDTCSDYVACQPAEACVGANECGEGYQYAFAKCSAIREEAGYNNSCGVVLNPFTGVYEGVHSDCNPDPTSECSPSNPEQCATCVVSYESGAETGAVPTGTCECSMPQRCALCSLNTHYRLNNRCQECPDNVWVIALAFTFLVLVAIAAGYYFNKKNLNLALLAIGIDFAQVLSVFSAVNLSWPAAFEKFLSFFSFLSLNIDIVGIECLVPSFEYETKWWLSQSMPLVVLGVLILTHVVYSAYKILRHSKRTKLMSHVGRLVAIYLVVCYVLYIAVTRKALEIFDCTQLPESDGYTYTSFTSMSCDGGSLCRCGEPGGVQQRLVPLAVIFLLVYTLGFPAFVFLSIRRHREVVMEDQYLRAHGVGDTRESGPRTYDFRKSFSTLYVSFKPNRQTWVVLVIMRKAFIAMCALLLRTNVTAVLAMVLLILFGSFVLTSLYRPYMSNGERSAVLKELDELATKGLDNPAFSKYTVLQRRVQESVKVHREQDHRHNASHLHGSTQFHFADDGDKTMARLAARTRRRRNAAEFFFDYNSVELALLGSAILICLGGILLQSMEGDSNLDGQRDTLSILLIVLIMLTIIYYVIAVCAEGFPMALSTYTHCLQRRRPDDHQIEDLDDNLNLSTNPIFLPGYKASKDDAKLRSELAENQQAFEQVAAQNEQLREQLRQQKREDQLNDDGTGTPLPPQAEGKSRRRRQFSFRRGPTSDDDYE
ncbi:Protocadherin Fat 4 [Hondaea fermentalgiana]|uniref:Protocadherin Fat 4 n=1 Tax=Hondaea fermentalgiana TaxID=2315210 RepID=A0A2R5GQM6_9STRA|nr:Protocadherin Fat 4 [Hondaea fermentalgiana]|eukprot:GBG32619.1 Protocadherin Fat 4 [Hondaea fermentalgiana]